MEPMLILLSNHGVPNFTESAEGPGLAPSSFVVLELGFSLHCDLVSEAGGKNLHFESMTAQLQKGL